MTQPASDLNDEFTRWLDSCPEDDEPLSREERAALAFTDAAAAALAADDQR